MADGLGAQPPAMGGSRGNAPQSLIAIAANFTADPLAETLRFWWPQLFPAPARLESAGYNQIFQQLITPTSLLASRDPGVNALLVRLEDWATPETAADALAETLPRLDAAQARPDDHAGAGARLYAGAASNAQGQARAEAQADARTETLRRTVAEFVAALTAFMPRAARPTFLILCPPSARAAADAGLLAVLRACDDQIQRAASGLRGLYVITAEQIAARYPVDQVDDAEAERQAHIPFTPAYWTALGTTLVRQARALLQPPAKVVVVDADNTLWGGVAAEAGAAQVDLTGGWHALQACLRDLKRQGLLLALVSKNREPDVAAVFDRPDMLLRRDDFVAWKINWDPKSRNIAALARELDLGLDSFIFLDDNPLECAEVAAHCPSVTVLPLPADADDYAHFLRHVWPFDLIAATATAADAQRTELYRQQRERTVFRESAPTLREFIAGLQLDVTVSPLQPPDYARAAQLTQRTNQFNTTGRRRTESELATLMAVTDRTAWLVNVRDRFGNYGAVGLAIFALDRTGDAATLNVDNLLLSCRVLGKGVEHQLLAALGTEATRLGATSVRLEFTPTDRNQPAERFLTATCGPTSPDAGAYQLSAAAAAAIAFDPDASLDAAEDTEPAAPAVLAAQAAPDVPPTCASAQDPHAADINRGASVDHPAPAVRVETADRDAADDDAIADRAGAVGVASYAVGTTDAASVSVPPGAARAAGGAAAGLRPDFLTIARELDSARAIREAMTRAVRRGRPVLANALVAPRTGDEERVAGIWAEVLHVEPVGVTDAFMDLGGRSLQAAWVAARMATELGVRVPLGTLLGNPTVAELAQLVRGAAAGTGSGVTGAVTARTLPKAGDSSMSAAQRRLWFLDQFIANRAAYNIPVARRLRGPLRLDALELALGDVVSRHEMLRSSYGPEAETAGVTINRATRVTLQRARVDFEADAMALAQREARREFSLAADAGGVMRCLVIAIGPGAQAQAQAQAEAEADADDHLLVLTVHHIASDGWSSGLLLRDLARAYVARCANRAWTATPPAASYGDYAAWQRTLMARGDFGADLDYWRGELQDAPALLELPTDTRRPPTMTYRGDVVTAQLSPAAREAIETLATRERCTPFAVLLAAWQTVLGRYSRQEDIVVGTAVAGRLHTAVEDVVGCFVNTVAIRTQVQGDRTFRDQLQIVRTKVQEALTHQQLPFEHLVQALQPERDPSRTPLFQVMLVLQDTPDADFAAPGLSVTRVPVHNGGAKFDLVLEVTPLDTGYDLSLELSTSLFTPDTAQRLLRHFVHLLHHACTTPDRTLATLPLMDAEELRQVLAPPPPTPTPAPVEAVSDVECLHTWFERCVARAPQAPALTCEGRTLSYDELNRRANQLAHHLIAAGVGPDVLVGLCVDRSLELVIAILGVLKAGGAYLPIDLSYPAERLAFMLADAQAPILLTQTTLAAALPAHAGRTVFVDDPDGTLAAQPTHNPSRTEVTPEQLAYVIYTSGSTGTPKGCMVTHRNVARLMRATEPWYGFDDGDVWTLFHSCAFDFSVWEIWGALLYGGRLVVVPFLVSRSPDAFLDLLIRERVTVLNQTPSAFRQLIEADARAADANTANTANTANAADAAAAAAGAGAAGQLALRFVIFGGEALDMQTLRPWFARHGDQQPRLVNMYGITETTVHVTYRPLSREDLDSGSVIGVPIPDLQCYIVDALGQPVPIGVPGEIYVGGAGLARGYLRRPELTNDRFVADYLLGRPFARLYRTGDLARRLASGDLEYLGRIDNQVKIRGFRIELGEIESVLGEHPAIREAVVVVREDSPGSRRLVAYLVASPPWPSSSDVRDHLRAKLPDYMLPAAFVFLERLPLTSNGKIDRRALPAPEPQRPDLAGRYVAPRTPTEETLAGIWSTVLRLAQVGVHDNFFALGGDSILSIQVVSAARRTGLRLTPTQFFANQTIAELAALLDAATTPPSDASTHEPEAAAPARGDLPLTPIQSWFFEQQLDAAHHYNQSFLFELREPLERPLVARALDALCRHHDALRLRFVQMRDAHDASGGGSPARWRQFYADAVDDPLPLDWHDLTSLDAAAQASRIEIISAAAQGTLNIEHGPLWRAVYFSCGPMRADRLLLVVHHLAVDGVSWRPLLEDFETAYGQLESGATVMLPPKSSSYRAWAERLHEAARAEALQAERDYWRSRTRAEAHVATDGENTEAAARTLSVALTADETHSLLHRVPQAYQTQINDLLLTALACASQRVTGDPVLVANLEGHGREPLGDDDGLDLSRTVGWFTSIFPVRLELPAADATDAEALKSVKEQLRQVPRRGIGFGMLRYLATDAPLASATASGSGGTSSSGSSASQGLGPEPSVLFNYLGQIDQLVARSTLLRFAPESTGPWHAPVQRRRHLLEVNGLVIRERLEVSWTYVPSLTSEPDVARLASEFIEALRRVIAHCESPQAWGRTPSDFPLARIDQEALDRLLATRHDAEDLYPLSPMQTLFLSAPQASGPAFDQWRCTLRGPLDVAAFQQAWQDVVDRHSILRSSFHADGLPSPLQLVHRSVRLPWTIEDWRDAAQAQETRWNASLHADATRPLPLAEAPVMRCALIRVADDAWRFVWSVPALLLDGWSWPLVFQDVSRAYDARTRQTTPRFEPVRPYRDYIEWLGTHSPDAARAFWTHTLAGLREPTPLPTEPLEPEPSSQANGNGLHATPVASRYLSRQMTLPAAETTALQAAAQRAHVTLNALVQSAWALILARQSGLRDVTFGAAFSGRPTDLSGAEAIVGPFVNNLPVRVGVDPQASLGALLRSLHARTLELSAFQFTSLMEIQRWSEMPWRHRLFDSLVVFQNYQVDDAARRFAGRIDVADFQGPVHTNFPVLLLAEPGPALRITLSFDRRRIASAAIDRWSADLSRLLTQMPHALDEPIATMLATLSAPPASTAAATTRTASARTTPVSMHAITLPRTPMERTIASVCQDMFELEQINIEENFFDLGATSLLLVRMHERLRASLNTDLSVVTLFQHPTVRALAMHLDQRVTPDTSSGATAGAQAPAPTQRQRAEQQKQALARLRTRPKK